MSLYHLNVKGCERQRVRTATELLSDTASKALLFYFPNEMGEQAEIISVIDGWFDVMNSRQKYTAKNKKCGLGKKIHIYILGDPLAKQEFTTITRSVRLFPNIIIS